MGFIPRMVLYKQINKCHISHQQNEWKKKSRKNFSKTQQPSMIKITQQIWYISKIYLKTIKLTWRINRQHYIKLEKAENVSEQSETSQEWLPSPLLFRAISQEKEMKCMHTEKWEVKLSLFASDIILYGKT